VTCKVQLVAASAEALRWRLTRHGHVFSHGVAFANGRQATVRIPGVNRLPRGRYVLRVAGGNGGTTFLID